MIRNLILVFIIALSQSIIGQTEKDSLMAKMKVLEPELDYIVQDFESNLRSKGVQLICSYGINSGEGWHTFNLEKARENPCVMLDERTVYIFWVEDKKTFATKFDTCNNFPIVNISESHAWEFYLRNEKLIQVEKSKLFQFNDGNKIIGTSEDHQSEREFFFMNKEEKFKVRFYYDHRFEESYDKKTNINFEYNRNLKSKQMMDLLNEMAKDFDNKNLIGSKRQNGK